MIRNIAEIDSFYNPIYLYPYQFSIHVFCLSLANLSKTSACDIVQNEALGILMTQRSLHMLQFRWRG